jgi:hypothetical protein
MPNKNPKTLSLASGISAAPIAVKSNDGFDWIGAEEIHGGTEYIQGTGDI